MGNVVKQHRGQVVICMKDMRCASPAYLARGLAQVIVDRYIETNAAAVRPASCGSVGGFHLALHLHVSVNS